MKPSSYRVTICYRSQKPELVDAMLLFRKQLFVDQLGWDLPVTEDYEADAFDRHDTVYSILQLSSTIVGGFRAIRTDAPYLAQIVFPQLAVTRPFPVRKDYWEISRFGVSPRLAPGRLALLNYAAMFRFAQMRQAKSLVALVDLTHERFLGKMGVRTRRYGPPLPIGYDAKGLEIKGVAGEIPLEEQKPQRLAAIIRLAENVEFNDEALVLGRECISA